MPGDWEVRASVNEAVSDTIEISAHWGARQLGTASARVGPGETVSLDVVVAAAPR